jgi:hypothetical protein
MPGDTDNNVAAAKAATRIWRFMAISPVFYLLFFGWCLIDSLLLELRLQPVSNLSFP